MRKLTEIYGVKTPTEQLMAVMYAPSQESHLKIVVEKLPENDREAQRLIKEKLDSPALSHDIKYIWELDEECIVYHAHRVGQVLIVSNVDYEKMKGFKS